LISALSRAWQSWTTAKAVAALAVIAFAFGIGSATAIYTVLNGVLLKPLPYPHGERFVALYSGNVNEPAQQRGAHTFPDLIEYQQRTHSFEMFGWFRPSAFNMTFAEQPQHVQGAAVTPSLAHNLGVNPMVGQWFSDPHHVVISYALWRRLGSDPSIVGKPMTLDGGTFTITGVMPAGFRLPMPGPGLGDIADVWILLDPLGRGQNRGEGLNFSYARLKTGVTFAQAEADVKRVAAEIAAMDPAGYTAYTAKLDNLRQSVIYDIRPTLILLIGAAAVLLLIACADVAGLLLSRSVARARETAIRVALGAGRWQLALHYFFEGLIVSLIGAAAGAVLSIVLVRVVLSIAADYIPRAEEIAIDWTVVVFSFVAACFASALASLAPLWQAMRTVPADVLNEGVRSSASTRSRRLSRSLVVAEIALAFTLLTISTLLVLHLRSLGRVAPGFDPRHLLTFEVTAPEREDMTEAERQQHEKRFISALEGIPGVTSAAFANQLPLDGCCISTTIYPEGRAGSLDAVQRTALLTVTPGFFRTMQIPLRSGRLLDERDTGDEPLPVLINEAAARVNWPNQNPVGVFGRAGSRTGSRFQVVGVVGDIRNDGLGKPTVPEIYLSSAIHVPGSMQFVMRSSLPPETLVPEVRRAIQTINPGQAIHQVAMMEEIAARSLSLPRVGSFMTAFFAIAALLMASLGIYGVVSYAVRQATVELGTRMALGASGRDLLLMVVGSGLRMAAYGVAIGAATVVATAWIVMRLFEIRELGITPFVLSTLVVGSIATVASFFPAWRATTLSPMVAIRNEPGSAWRSTRQGLSDMFQGVSRAVSLPRDEPRLADSEVVAEFVSAARGADSFGEALERALATLRDRIGAESLTLLERHADGYQTILARPGERPSPVLPVDGFLVGRLKSYTYPLPLSASDLEGWIRWARENAPWYLDELQTLVGMEARLAVALRTKEDIVGFLVLGPPAGRTHYRTEERLLLRQCAEQLTLMLENARLMARVLDQERVRRDLALAAEVQKRLLPDRPPDRSIASLAAVSLPARSVGGDYYDFIDLGDQRIGIALADVAGKGIAAALIMAVVQASLRIVAADGRTSLPELAEKINGFLHRSTGSNSYATFFYAQLDEQSRRLTYVNAGHNPPYLLREAEIHELNVGGTVLGLFPQMTYEEATVALRPGDVLVAFTDGVIEALNASEEEFGENRLKELLREVIHLPAAEISARISATLRAWIKGTDQYDDLTFVVLKVN
jgi:predicted permease